MKKIILALVFVGVVAVGYYFLTNLDVIIKSAIEKYGSAATHTAVRVEQVRLKLTDGVETGIGRIKGLSIANPNGFSNRYAFSMDEIFLAVDLQSLNQAAYIINEINIHAPQVYVDVNENNKVNLNVLKRAMSSNKPQPNSTEKEQTIELEQDKSKQPLLKIRKIVLAQGVILLNITALNNKIYTLKLPSLTMMNLGGKHGLTATEMTKEILNRLIDKVKKEIKNSKYSQQLEVIKEKLKLEVKATEIKVKQKIKNEKMKAKSKVDNETEKLKQKTNNQLEKEQQKIKSKLKNIFSQ